MVIYVGRFFIESSKDLPRPRRSVFMANRLLCGEVIEWTRLAERDFSSFRNQNNWNGMVSFMAEHLCHHKKEIHLMLCSFVGTGIFLSVFSLWFNVNYDSYAQLFFFSSSHLSSFIRFIIFLFTQVFYCASWELPINCLLRNSEYSKHAHKLDDRR